MSGGESTADYVGKVGVANYVVKSDGQIETVSPAHAAKAYEALEGTRVVQWARGWAPPKKIASTYSWYLRRATDDELRRFNAGVEKKQPSRVDVGTWRDTCRRNVDSS